MSNKPEWYREWAKGRRPSSDSGYGTDPALTRKEMNEARDLPPSLQGDKAYLAPLPFVHHRVEEALKEVRQAHASGIKGDKGAVKRYAKAQQEAATTLQALRERIADDDRIAKAKASAKAKRAAKFKATYGEGQS